MSQPKSSGLATRILEVSSKNLGSFRNEAGVEKLSTWDISDDGSPSIGNLREAAAALQAQDVPVAFPTETVYGLGADATRSGAVRGIYAAKGRPVDNPLIVHVPDLTMLRTLLQPKGEPAALGAVNGHDSIPSIYKPLIERFWPGPLTILLKNPVPSRLAPEVTAGLPTFGARMPASSLARSLMQLCNAPLAAPSANASTRPSPTTAQHVLEDLDGRIELILDGGPCSVGVESTVVDGLCNPPVVLRPGGVSIDELRTCPGWENVERAYRDGAELGKEAPRAPGMKYKHYSPKAKVVLYEDSFVDGRQGIASEDLEDFIQEWSQHQMDGTTNKRDPRVGIIRTRFWKTGAGLQCVESSRGENPSTINHTTQEDGDLEVREIKCSDATRKGDSIGIDTVLDVSIGADTRSIAKGLFSALRELDKRGADIIFVEGTVDDEDIGAAVMNRLRKAASKTRS